MAMLFLCDGLCDQPYHVYTAILGMCLITIWMWKQEQCQADQEDKFPVD